MLATFELEDALVRRWNSLPESIKKQMTSASLSALLNGKVYPSGSEQLELAIDLAESGVEAKLISKITRLDQSVFEAFLRK